MVDNLTLIAIDFREKLKRCFFFFENITFNIVVMFCLIIKFKHTVVWFRKINTALSKIEPMVNCGGCN